MSQSSKMFIAREIMHKSLGWPKISKILKSISLTRVYENMDPIDEGNANRNVWWWISTLPKPRTLYKGNFKKYKGKSWK